MGLRAKLGPLMQYTECTNQRDTRYLTLSRVNLPKDKTQYGNALQSQVE
jgi:hypothetical protein